ncbi:hypothetical protein RSAG8_06295, partial [Rhizoctonia solani AG-8 WAC10335]
MTGEFEGGQGAGGSSVDSRTGQRGIRDTPNS